MRCPYCEGTDLKVTDSRNATEVNAVRRRRECAGCQRRFTTFETIELNIQVKKRDGRYEDFQISKLQSGIEAACRHTKVSRDAARNMAAKVTAEIMDLAVNEITTKEIGERVMKQLEMHDQVAYIRFACEYRRFNDIGELMDALKGRY